MDEILKNSNVEDVLESLNKSTEEAMQETVIINSIMISVLADRIGIPQEEVVELMKEAKKQAETLTKLGKNEKSLVERKDKIMGDIEDLMGKFGVDLTKTFNGKGKKYGNN